MTGVTLHGVISPDASPDACTSNPSPNAGVDENTAFETQTRGEIAEIKWHSLKDVTAASRPDAAGKSKYFGVAPVLNHPNL